MTSSSRHTGSAPRTGILQRLGFACLLLFLFLSYSRLTDVLLANLYLPLIASLLALVVTVLTGGLPRALFSGVGIWMSAFSVWLVLAVPFSSWQGGSAYFVRDQWLKSFLIFVIIGGLPRTLRQCRLAMYSLAGATVVIMLLCLLWGQMSMEGRLITRASAGSALANPNDLAQLLLMGLPFLLLVTMSRGRFALGRYAAALCIIGVVFVTSATGSRSALVAIVCLLLVMFLNASWGARFKLIGAVVLAAAIVIPLTSGGQLLRYSTIVGVGTESDISSDEELGARMSTQQRLLLLTQSVEFSLGHPLFGVGPGQFQTFAASRSEERGERALWRDPHNTYTQISSEAGIPALFCYLGALVACFRITQTVSRTGRERALVDLANVAYCLRLSLISFAVTGLFSSVGYHIYFPTLAGLSVALSYCAAAELEAARRGTVDIGTAPVSAAAPVGPPIGRRPPLPV
jgi:O-antigen ligase